ncbi:sugar-binding protein [Aestuariimicrobium ganziense]|uniref:sugar-binding protein n=1 Tax=Aestuariimicrobium ganziense TaxID=2773677 RepID=UPI001943DA46|nr:sugar-binding protein [Aestuariimicrobium ganziense]
MVGLVPNSAQADDVVVDRYGQVASVTWPNKVTSDQQLRGDVAADAAYYGKIKPPKTDAYGGNPGSGKKLGLTATGWFHVENHDGRSVLVDPAGNEFFSLGMNVFCSVGDTYTKVAGRESIYEWLPDGSDPKFDAGWRTSDKEDYSFYIANQVRKYGSWDESAYCDREVQRAKKLGFNSVGGWSNLDLVRQHDMPYVAHIDSMPFYEIGWSGLYDIYRPGLQAEIDAAVAGQVSEFKDDKNLIGYMFFNEIMWSRLRTAVSEQPASEVASKGALVDLLEKRHNGDITSFNKAWDMDVASFEALRELSFTPKTDAAVVDMNAFTAEYLDLFYKTFSSAIRKADPNHMVIGDRWYTKVMVDDTLRAQLATAAGKHLDALTYNYYAWDLDLEMLGEIYRLSGNKPMFLSEFHYGEPSHGLTFAIKMAADELQKGLLYRNYVEKAAASGMVVGTHWFEAHDQAATGRWFQGFDGEAGGIGLTDVTDRPYKVFQAEVIKANHAIYRLTNGKQKPYQYAFGPDQIERDSNNITQVPVATTAPVIDGTLDANWPDGPTLSLGANNLTDGVALEGVSADFRLAWDQTNLYVHATVTDPTPMLNRYHGFDIWNGDAVEIFVGPDNVDQGGGIQVNDSQIIISGQPQDANGTAEYYWYNSRTDQPAITAVVKPAPGGWTMEAAIPLSALNIDGVNPPQQLRFDIGFDDGNGAQRQRQFLWNGVESNAANREKWGRAWLVETVAAEPPGQPGPSNPTATVSAKVAAPGEYLTVSATGLNPGEKLAVTFDGLRIGTLVGAADGSASDIVRVPSNVRPGQHTVQVLKGTDVVLSTKVRVTK